jgi:hypothetical protein
MKLKDLLKKITPLPWTDRSQKPIQGKEFWANVTYERHAANCLPELVEAAKRAAKKMRAEMEAHNKHLESADQDSQFYGEDIVTPTVLLPLEAALARAENVKDL